jgi:hypothetical protein
MADQGQLSNLSIDNQKENNVLRTKKRTNPSVIEKIQIDLGNGDENNDKSNCSNKRKRIHFKTLNVQLDGMNEKSNKRKKLN